MVMLGTATQVVSCKTGQRQLKSLLEVVVLWFCPQTHMAKRTGKTTWPASSSIGQRPGVRVAIYFVSIQPQDWLSAVAHSLLCPVHSNYING